MCQGDRESESVHTQHSACVRETERVNQYIHNTALLPAALTLFNHVHVAIVQSVVSKVGALGRHDLLHHNGGVDAGILSNGSARGSESLVNDCDSFLFIFRVQLQVV